MMYQRVLPVIGALLLLGAGCGSRTVVRETDGVRTTVETERGDESQGTITIEDTESGGRVVAGTTAIPSSFPTDVPRKPEAEFTGYTEAAPGVIVTASFRGPGTLAEWTDYYHAAFQAEGWVAEPAYTVGDASLINVAKDGRTISMTIAKDENDPSLIAVAMLFGRALPSARNLPVPTY